MARPKATCEVAITWVRNRVGKTAMAALTSTDVKALRAFVHLVELYLHSDREHAAAALQATVRMMQPKTRYIAKMAIPGVGDWSHESEIWEALGGCLFCDGDGCERCDGGFAHRSMRESKAPPSDTPPDPTILVYSVPLGFSTTGSACAHRSSGCWCFEHEGIWYSFSPQTNLQKDIWVRGGKTEKGREKRSRMLRWFCAICETIQEP